MEIERRGKYEGVKVHMSPKEMDRVVAVADYLVTRGFSNDKPVRKGEKLIIELGDQIKKIVAEDPTVVQERTEEEIKEVLQKEFDSAQKKLKAMEEGVDWKAAKTKKGKK